MLLVLVNPLNAAILGDIAFATAGVAAADNSNSAVAEQLAGCQCCQSCKEKN